MIDIQSDTRVGETEKLENMPEAGQDEERPCMVPTYKPTAPGWWVLVRWKRGLIPHSLPADSAVQAQSTKNTSLPTEI